MPSLRSLLLAALTVVVPGCSGDAEPAADVPLPDPEPAELSLRAVDAESGEELGDDEMTVRYLVRTPITLDAAEVERVASGEPYRIAHDISSDSLVVEIRMEAPSYEPLDTVLRVARGASIGPVDLPLGATRERMAEATAPTASAPGPDESAAPPPSRPSTSGAAGQAPAGASGADMEILRRADEAFNSGDWMTAADAYRRMSEPRSRSGDYVREYVLSRVRLGISHINLGEWQRAHQALREAVSYDFREYSGYFYLAQVQCTLGQFGAGRESLSTITGRLAWTISEQQRPVVLALVEFQRAMCSYGEFQRAQGAQAVDQAGRRALQDFREFIEHGEGMNPTPPAVQSAMDQARQIMAGMRSGG